MKWKSFVRDYLSFTYKERLGLLAFASIIIIIFLLPGVISSNSPVRSISTDTAWIAAAKKLEINQVEKDKKNFYPPSRDRDNGYAYQYDRSVNSYSSPGSLFNFDPNTLDEAGWKKLGLKEKTIRTIQNYLRKGGHFYKAEDLKKIYGLHPNDYSRFEPFIQIEGARSEDRPVEYVKKETGAKRFTYSTIDINTADTAAFISLPGIGSKLAARIVNFRDKLGGFYSISQIGETYGLPDSSFQKIKPYLKLENTAIKKININTSTIDELKAHPYIKYSLAKPIIAYRNEHGAFSKIEDIRKVMAVTDTIYNSILPYLSIAEN